MTRHTPPRSQDARYTHVHLHAHRRGHYRCRVHVASGRDTELAIGVSNGSRERGARGDVAAAASAHRAFVDPAQQRSDLATLLSVLHRASPRGVVCPRIVEPRRQGEATREPTQVQVLVIRVRCYQLCVHYNSHSSLFSLTLSMDVARPPPVHAQALRPWPPYGPGP